MISRMKCRPSIPGVLLGLLAMDGIILLLILPWKLARIILHGRSLGEKVEVGFFQDGEVKHSNLTLNRNCQVEGNRV